MFQHLALHHVLLTDELPGCSEVHVDCGHGEGDAETHRLITLFRNNSIEGPDCGTRYAWRPQTKE